jgi:Mce-associated membrane protein
VAGAQTRTGEPVAPESTATGTTERKTDSGGGARPWRGGRGSDPVRTVSIVLAAIAAASAAWFGAAWYRAAHDDSLHFAQARDEALRSGGQAIQNLNTLDYRDVRRGLTSWLDSTTGDLHDQIEQGRGQFEQQVLQARTTSTARILDGAVTELDERTGKARIIVAIQLTVTAPDGAPTTKQSRLQGELTRTDAGWKLSALGQAAVGTGAGAPGGAPSPGR